MSEIAIAIELFMRITTSLLWLALVALGLGIIFGIMGVINLAHGALLTAGAYVAWQVTTLGINLGIAMLLAFVVVAIIGFVIERSIIQFLYNRPLDTLLATWGLSLVIQEIIKVIFGTSSRTVYNPFPGSWDVLGATVPRYRVVISLISISVLLTTYILFMYTSFGVKSRAVIENEEMASRLGVNVSRVYTVTFMYGAGIAGLAGAAMAPLVSVEPQFGLLYLVQSFFVVIVGGTGHVLLGTLAGSTVIGGFRSLVSTFTAETIAFAVVFTIAMVIVRLKPNGIIKND